MHRFKLGDRVKVINKIGFSGIKQLFGKIATIISLEERSIGLEFDFKFPCGHACGGRGKPQQCRWGSPLEVELADKNWDD